MHFARIAIAVALAGALPLAACGASNDDRTPPSVLAGDSTPVPASGDTVLERRADHARIQGAASAPLWIVEVSDFQCPYCRTWHEETYHTIVKEYVETGKVRLAYINFPLSGHKNAWPAAEAAMCAAAQDKFWPVHDGLFNEQEKWGGLPDPTALFDSIATRAGVDLSTYRDCISKHEMRALIQGDIDRATESGVNATPSFIIGSTMISGAQPAAAFREIIAKELRAKQGDEK
ncbi:MAG TPA: thioredoxin domain-containing protein [Gemmatimonadaceae bacterium]